MNGNGEIILIKEGEIALKGLNKPTFEKLLVRDIKQKLKPCGSFEISRSQSTITLKPLNSYDLDEVKQKLEKVFGIASFCVAVAAEKDMDSIKNLAENRFKEQLSNCETFKVEAKRSDKKFPLNSNEICCELGEFLLEKFKNLKVKVKNPDIVVKIEIRDEYAFLYCEKFKGAGGIPKGAGGDGLILISGGIDSPVAAYLMAKRGLKLQAVHFSSPPYTSIRSQKKVESLLLKLCNYLDCIPFHCVNFAKIQEQIKKNCPQSLSTIIGRRTMMKIAERIAQSQNSKGFCKINALITGESLGQVASQTLEALCCTNEACSFPIFRPLIGMDKSDIVNIAKEIETFETSILPFEDCCSVFAGKHPKTKPSLEEIKAAELKFDLDGLIEEALNSTEFKLIR